jgi:F-type H+-transporting ATPase subunit a
MEEIKIAPDVIFEISGFKITNTVITSTLVSCLILLFVFIFRKKISMVPSGFYNLIESVIEFFYEFVKEQLGEKGKKFFPLIFTIFFYVVLSNWFGIMPFINSLQINHENEYLHIFRSTFSDINMTIGLALASMISIHFISLKNLKLAHIKKFLNFENPFKFFIGILEGFSEISKILSFSFRLFGNIFAGEVLLVIVGSLIPIAIPVPFLGLEIFVGFIQAVIFSALTMVFLKIHLEKH